MENGAVVLDEPSNLPDGTPVDVEPANIEELLTSLRDGLLQFSGILKDLPEDMAENHDFYAHGKPRE